jgi:TolB protein
MLRPLTLTTVALALLANAGASRASNPVALAEACDPGGPVCFRLESTIAFSSTRDQPTANPFVAGEIYLIKPEGTDPQRLTHNSDADAFAALSPNGKKIVFDSNRERAADEPINTSDLFLMNTDGSEQTFLTRGSSATWSPDAKEIAFHASASGSGTPLRTDPGSATTDSDIFVANVDDVLEHGEAPTNITRSWTESNGQRIRIADDPDWSPDGRQIVFTAHEAGDDPPSPPFISNTAEIYVLAASGTGTPQRLTSTSLPDDGLPDEEERGPDWSPDGTRIEFMCRIGGARADFEICVMNADGTNRVQLTDNTVPDLSADWSPDGQKIVFHRPLAAGQGSQLFTMNAALNPDGTLPTATQLTFPPGINLLASWGELRVRG